tara:strand:+ start:1434 stop:1844 length:411 start_codon:yes stop_codon:yes gene_type:complete
MFKFSSTTSFKLPFKESVSLWLLGVVNKEEKALKEIAFTFCNDQELLKVNQEFLSHDNLTDVITFDYSDSHGIIGEVLISIDRVQDNAQDFNQSFDVELRRVMVHGTLHLCGYNDKSADEKLLMTKKEDFYLSRYV